MLASLRKMGADAEPDYDVLIVDDHSVDETVEVMHKMGVKIITKKHAMGLTHSWNI
eukprot:Pgem_evm1s15089